MKYASLLLLVTLVLVSSFPVAAERVNPYVGFWEMSADEDGTPKDTMQIRADGTYIAQGWTCQTHDVIPYHLFKGDMYATIEIPKKGPISIVFRYLKNGRLSFTSPRSRNNAYYRRLDKNACPQR